jgi:hypothetical protein
MVFGITCPRCDGSKVFDGETCEMCQGRGDQWIFRCPASIVDSSTRGLARAYGAFQVGVLPDMGGLYALSIYAAEKEAIEANERGN